MTTEQQQLPEHQQLSETNESSGTSEMPPQNRRFHISDSPHRDWGRNIPPQSNGNTITNLQNSLASRNLEIRQLRNNKLQDHRRIESLQDENSEIWRDYKQVQNVLADTQRKYECIRDDALVPYANASSRSQPFHDETLRSVRSIAKALLQDALAFQKQKTRGDGGTDVRALQRHVEVLEKNCKETDELRKEVESKHEEVGVLQEQVQLLQREMLSKIETAHAVPDEKFAQDFRSLVALIKSLSRSARPGKELEVSKVLQPNNLLCGVQEHHWSTRSRKKQFIEGWIWSILIDMVFLHPFIIFPRNGGSMEMLWISMFEAHSSGYWPTPSIKCEDWRTTTMQQLADRVGRDAITRGESTEDQLEDSNGKRLRDDVAIQREKVANTIGGGLLKVSSTTDVTQISNIINKAFSLALELSLQRSRLQVTFPRIGEKFSAGEMTCLPDRDGEDLENNENGTVAFIVNPGLAKWGDAHGRNFDQRYDIVPSLVQLEVFKVKMETDDMDLDVA